MFGRRIVRIHLDSNHWYLYSVARVLGAVPTCRLMLMDDRPCLRPRLQLSYPLCQLVQPVIRVVLPGNGRGSKRQEQHNRG